MGYYVAAMNSSCMIPTANIDAAYAAMCALSAKPDLMSGGSYKDGKIVSRNFAWMDADYAIKCANAEEILNELGFYTETDDDGLWITDYDNKSGDEDVFLDAISPYAKGMIEWEGEDGACWRTTLGGPAAVVEYGRTVYGT